MQKLFKSPKIGDIRRKFAVFVLLDGDILSLELRILRAQNGFVGEKASRTHDRRGGNLKRALPGIVGAERFTGARAEIQRRRRHDLFGIAEKPRAEFARRAFPHGKQIHEKLHVQPELHIAVGKLFRPRFVVNYADICFTVAAHYVEAVDNAAQLDGRALPRRDRKCGRRAVPHSDFLFKCERAEIALREFLSEHSRKEEQTLFETIEEVSDPRRNSGAEYAVGVFRNEAADKPKIFILGKRKRRDIRFGKIPLKNGMDEVSDIDGGKMLFLAFVKVEYVSSVV